MAKPGLDGHDRGAKVVARGLRDAGFEVIYTGLHQTPEMVVQAALQEDVDIVGLSILSGAHIPLVTAVQNLMKKEGLNRPIFVGGIIPGDDAELLRSHGVEAVFGPGTSIAEIAEEVRRVATSSGKTESVSAKTASVSKVSAGANKKVAALKNESKLKTRSKTKKKAGSKKSEKTSLKSSSKSKPIKGSLTSKQARK